MNTRIKTKYGTYIGVEEEEAIVFKSIPYAQAPVGNLRYRSPRRLLPSTEEYDATKFRARSLQCAWEASDGFYEKEFPLTGELDVPVSEDSLYLNLWLPKNRTEEKLPVLFLIHGGGFGSGAGHELEFLTDAYAKRGIIFITLNYRLGMTGFLVHPWLIEEDPSAVGNYGILDQILALNWVQENIAQFGGDPGRVTICGQSAGAISVQAILASRYGDGKYCAAIQQSGSGYPQILASDFSMEEAIENGKRYVAYLGVESLEELRRVPAEQLMDAQMKLIHACIEEKRRIPFGPVRNGYVLETFLTESIEKGSLYPVPTIIGCNRDDLLISRERASSLESRMYRSNLAYSLMNETRARNPAYVYFFKRALPGDAAGAFHSGELWYTMGSIGRCWRPMTEADYDLSERMVTYWSNFVKTGNPASADTEPWGTCRIEDPFVKIFDIEWLDPDVGSEPEWSGR